MRAKRGRQMTQAELGKAAGVSDSMIGHYELEAHVPEQERWERMADAMEVRFRWLVFAEEPRNIAKDRRYEGKKPARGKRAG